MVIAFGATVLLILTVFGTCLQRALQLGAGRAYLACLPLYQIYFNEISQLQSLLLVKVLICAFAVAIAGFFISSGHFVISLDIVAYFSLLILIFFQSLKITQPQSAR